MGSTVWVGAGMTACRAVRYGSSELFIFRLNAMKRSGAPKLQESGPPRPILPHLDALKAQLATLSPEQRQKMWVAFAELVRKRLNSAGNQP